MSERNQKPLGRDDCIQCGEPLVTVDREMDPYDMCTPCQIERRKDEKRGLFV